MAIDRKLHKYTLGEELVSSISHGAGAVLAVIGTALGSVYAYNFGAAAFVSVLLFGIFMALLYAVSTVYHSLAANGGKKVMRILDHCFVYVLIIATYAPYCLVALSQPTGLILYIINCSIGVIGITFTAIDMKKFGKFAMTCYILMGWLIIFALNSLVKNVPAGGILLLLLGGAAYTVGAVIYGLGRKLRYAHSVWHFFVLAGSMLHYFSVMLYVIR